MFVAASTVLRREVGFVSFCLTFVMTYLVGLCSDSKVVQNPGDGCWSCACSCVLDSSRSHRISGYFELPSAADMMAWARKDASLPE